MTASDPPTRPTGPDDRSDAPGGSTGARVLVWFNVVLLGAQALVICVYLWPQWRHNPDLSHGLFMPLVFALLVWESRRSRPLRHPRAGVLSFAATVLLAALAVAGLTAGGLFAVSLGWSHSLVSFVVVAAFATALLAGLAALSAAPPRLVPLNWITFAAVALWLLAAPMPPGTYTTLTLRLQTWVTGHVLTALHVLGVAAGQRGNLIDLANTTVGVEEACSGIRSLIACLYAGLFFSALLVRRPWARAVLLLLAGPLAVVMNFGRSLTLTLLANEGVDISGFWHDVTGYAILGLTALVLVGCALLLEPPGRPPAPAEPVPPGAPGSGRALFATQAVLAGFLVLASGIATFFVSHTRAASLDRGPPPNLEAALPAAADGWRVLTSGDLYRFADTLQTSDLVQRSYFKGTPENFTQITVYLAYWPAGQTTVSNVAVHTPDACWPGVGWQLVPSAAGKFDLRIGGRQLPAAEYRLFTSNEYPQHVWFWHLYDGAPIIQRDPRSPRELLALAWRYGFRKDADQLFVRVSSNRPWNAIADEPLLAGIFAHLHAFGL
jgi:exosortase